MFGSTHRSDGRQGRHGSARALLAGGFTTAVVAGSIVAAAGTSNAATGWDGVAQCESGGNASTNTGNGYYGLYQFDQRTWQSLGYGGTANEYSAAVQTQAAERLYAQSGSAPWPVCGANLSGSANTSGSSSASRSHTRHGLTTSHVSSHYVTRSSLSNDTSSRTSYTHHAYPSDVLGPWMIMQKRSDVRAVQQKLNGTGAGLAVDGQYGQLTAGAVKRFQARAGISVDGLYGSRTKAALFG